ncbi:hypothetical protein B2H97_12985 [Paraclostridium bifermentans]|uniref:hypothetical protein n=1 Tax=Paraclostridium bifermentans TaxID=1490 RepID=UPI000A16D330|nr:hypothetical protein [Paraclostridium bifermentans]OSB08869.1 hypothetical protein B2H97_12985 [Paraclostridium bifermentans]
MSRLKILKERNKLKTTMVSLALALSIGLIPSLETYAIFKDSESMTEELSISTGDVDVRVDEGFNIVWSEDEHDDENIMFKAHEFKIYNEGTLKENLRLNLSTDKDISKYVKYTLKFDKYKDRQIQAIDLSTKDNKELRYEDNKELVVLNSGDSLSAKLYLNIDEDIEDLVEDLESIKVGIDINILASQINKSNTIEENGFYDREVQKNSITIIDDDNDDDNVIPSGSIKVSAKDTTIDINHETNDSNGYIGLDRFIDNYDQVINIDYISGNGAFSKSNGYSKNSTYQIYPVDVKGISRNFEKKNTIVLKFNYKDGSYKKYMLDFRAEGSYGNRLLEAQVWLIESNRNSIDEDKQEEVEIPTLDSEQLYSDQEGASDSTKSQELEIPNYTDVIEPPKVEVEASQSDAMEPTKEEMEIQE